MQTNSCWSTKFPSKGTSWCRIVLFCYDVSKSSTSYQCVTGSDYLSKLAVHSWKTLFWMILYNERSLKQSGISEMLCAKHCLALFFDRSCLCLVAFYITCLLDFNTIASPPYFGERYIFIEAQSINQNSSPSFRSHILTCMWNLAGRKNKKLKGPQIISRKLKDTSNRLRT